MNNQQERLDIKSWIVGYTDGEGCFSVSIIRNKTSKTGWQVFPEFVITQGIKSIDSLKIVQKYFKCGNIFENKRNDNHKESLAKYCVRNRKDLELKITPFFNQYHLITAKKKDFQIFKKILVLMNNKKHLTVKGLKEIALLIEKMNRKKFSRYLESSETKRHTP